MSIKNIAIILAGGSGTRFGGEIPKQFQFLDGKRVIDYSVETFSNHKDIDCIIIVCHRDWLKILKQKYSHFTIIEGGKTRKESSYFGLKACPNDVNNVLIHDASRPFITDTTISNCIQYLNKYEAVNLSFPVMDSVAYIEDDMVGSMLDRHSIYLNQTPQSFRYDIILKAHEKFSNIDSTDDITLAKNMGIKVYNLKGDRNNIKITYKEDLNIGEIIINNQSKEKI